MAVFTKECLETLRQRIDLVEVIQDHMDLKRSGTSYKGLCPFHDEKTPSFMIQKGDTHYHCFGCGAHGDAIQFLMSHLNLGFSEAVEMLAQRFHVTLDTIEGDVGEQGPKKSELKRAMEAAARFYHLYLLHTDEGHEALQYLYKRGLDLDFIKLFQIGLAPARGRLLKKALNEMRLSDEVLMACGLLAERAGGRKEEFFSERIQFPIHDAQGSVIGFSGRKYKDSTFGGKYVNTPETPLFKKSQVLYGLHHSRKRIAKEQRVIIVEGQIDALRLIQSGLNCVVAGQGTAFGEGHLRELIKLGIKQAYLALDGDAAGGEATLKIGNLFQKEGIEVKVVHLPNGSDPDAFLRERGIRSFVERLKGAKDFLHFLVHYHTHGKPVNTPAVKHQVVQEIARTVRAWEQPVMVHEALRQLARMMQVPESVIGVGQEHLNNIYIKRSGTIGMESVDPDRILEADFIRWILLAGEEQDKFIRWAKETIPLDGLRINGYRRLYGAILATFDEQKHCDLMSLATRIEDTEVQLILSDLLKKKVDRNKGIPLFFETMQKLCDRNWMLERERIKVKIQSGQLGDTEVMELVKEFDALKDKRIKLTVPQA